MTNKELPDHDLKILPCYFKAVTDGHKNFEIRKNHDRGFQKGDIVVLREYDNHYTRKDIIVRITYVTNYQQKDDYVVFGFEHVKDK